ncbi:MAG: ArsB/NhaD family transporter [Methanoculleaceae archaeon]
MILIELIAILVFIITYILIVDERVHRAVAAMAGAAMVVLLGIVPWDVLLKHLDFKTIFLLLGMMIIINTARNSGLFEYIAIITAKAARGDPIRVLLLFSFVTAITSAFLDNVTTVLLLTPMLLYIARIMEINPLPFLLTEIFSSNIGGMATLIGDPPNIMIASSAGLSFNEFLVTMGPIALVDMLIVLLIFYLIYGRDLRVNEEERGALIRSLDSLDERAAIQDIHLFRRSVATILIVIALFFLHSSVGAILHPIIPIIPADLVLEPAEVALIGASLILLWTREPPELIFERVEWGTLFFFGGLFVVVGALVETGVISDISGFLVTRINSTSDAIFLIAWFSAFSSAIVDNIPLTAALIPLIHDMSGTIDPYPLWWALSLGACLGGNGSAIGASANVVVIGIAERENIRITFFDFLKMGMLIMVVTVSVGLGLLYLMF